MTLLRQSGEELDALSIQDIFTRRPYTKIDAIGRLHVISALDHGHSKVEVAREFGVHPQTIAYIYKQKERILKQCKQTLISMKDVRSLNLDITLLDWFRMQARNGNIVTEQQMRNRATEILSGSDEKFQGLDYWLIDFRLRHNILKHTPNNNFHVHSIEKWFNITKGFHTQDVYLGGTCALFHRLDLDNFFDNARTDQRVSVMFITSSCGSDKKKLLVFGDEHLQDNGKLSLPLDYCQCLAPPIVNYSSVLKYLNKWNIQLKGLHREVALVLDIPHNLLRQMHFENIRLIHPSEVDHLEKALEKVSVMFKHNYRKQQISKFFSHTKEEDQSILQYLNMISLAWHIVSATYIHRLFYPPPEGTLHLHENEDEIKCETLSEWSRSCNLPLEPSIYSTLDQYVLCDKDISSFTYEQVECKEENYLKLKPEIVQITNGNSGIHAYQAVKRLITYLQGEDAKSSTIESARALENHLEYCALVELLGMLPDNSTNNVTG